MRRGLGSLLTVFLVMFLIGCQPSAENETRSLEAADDGFVEAESSDREQFLKMVTAYLHYRTQAVLNNDIDVLWDQYPYLQEGIDRERGINAEKFEVASLNTNREWVDANFDPERYGRIRVNKTGADAAIVRMHGSILYVSRDFGESGGEYVIDIHLQKKDHAWTVVKTDEFTLPEYKARIAGQPGNGGHSPL